MQNDRKRLIELIVNAPKIPILINGIASGKVYQTAEHIADHLLANGVIVPPCKVGDRVYQTDGIRIYEHEVLDFYYHQNKLLCETEYIDFDDTAIGKSIFLSREEAEAALRRKLPSDVSEKIMKHFTEVE